MPDPTAQAAGPGHPSRSRNYVGDTVTILADPASIAALTSFRRELLALLDHPASATGLADRLGTTRQRVNYHLHALEDAGLVDLVEERARRGGTERMLQRRADVVLVDPHAFADVDLGDRDRIGLAGVTTTAGDIIRHAVAVGADAAARGEHVAMATLDTEIRVASPAAMRALLKDLAATIARHATDGPGLRLRVATMAVPARVDLPRDTSTNPSDTP